MVQTRHMIKNNITISDIESRHFHVNDYKEKLPPWSWTRTSNWSVRGKINFIFKSFDSRGLYPKSTQTITGRDHIIDPVKLISFRYEIRENKLQKLGHHLLFTFRLNTNNAARFVCIPFNFVA